MKPHALIIVENLPVPRDYRVWLFATTLVEAGYAVSVISPADQKNPPGVFKKDGVLILRHKIKEAKSWLFYPYEYLTALLKERALARRLYQKKPFQIIHLCNPPDFLWINARTYQKRGVKIIFDHHDLSPELILAKKNVTLREKLSFPFRLLYDLLLKLEKTAQEKANLVFATNATYREKALERDATPAEKIFVVRSGIREKDLMKSLPEPLAFSTRPTLDLAYVGVMARQDGVDLLLKAIASLKKMTEKKIRLTLMGDGPEFENLKALAHTLNLEEETNFLGFVSREEIFRRLKSGVIGITPDPKTPMNEASTMLKTLDYLAAGAPQVMFALKEHKNTCGEAALYVTPNDPQALAEGILKIASDDALFESLRKKGLERVAELAWEKDGKPQLLKAYSKLKA